MARMIRKQIYLRPSQDRLLKEMAGKTGISEAECIREALERHLAAGSGLRPDPAVWRIEQEFIHGRKNNPAGETRPRAWKREDLYDR